MFVRLRRCVCTLAYLSTSCVLLSVRVCEVIFIQETGACLLPSRALICQCSKTSPLIVIGCKLLLCFVSIHNKIRVFMDVCGFVCGYVWM